MFRLLKALNSFLTPQFGGGGGGNTTTNTDPWSGVQPYLKDLFAQAQTRQQSGGAQYYPGQTLASQDPRSKEGLDMATSLARNQMGQTAATATNAFNTLANASDVNNNPNLNAAISAATAPAIRAFQDPNGPLSQIRGGFTDAQQFGGTRQGLAEGVAADRLQQNVLGTGQLMAQQAYQSGLDATAKGLALGPQVNQMQMAPATTLDAVGQESRTQQQQVIDDMLQRYNYGQNQPDVALRNYQSLLTGNFGGQTSQSGGGPSRTNQAIGLAATGAGLGAYIAAGTSVGGPYGAAIGAGVGLLASLFSN